MKFFLLFFTFLWPLSLWSQSFQPLSHSIGLADKIIVRGYKGSLQIVPADSDSNVLRVEGKIVGKAPKGQWTLEMQKKDNTIEVFVKENREEDDWSKFRSGQKMTEFDLKVTAPAKPMEVFWNWGRVSSRDWKESLSVQMNQGRIESQGGAGSLFFNLINGVIDILDHQGDVKIQSFNGQVTTKKTRGSMEIDNHSAVCRLASHRGNLDLRNFSGSVTVNQFKGSGVVRNINGRLDFKKFNGNFEGNFKKGSLSVDFENLENFVVKNEEAELILDFPEDSGAFINLKSRRASLVVPSTLRKLRRGGWTEQKGYLAGKKSGKVIKIVSQYGRVVFK